MTESTRATTAPEDRQAMSHEEMLDLCAQNPALASGLPIQQHSGNPASTGRELSAYKRGVVAVRWPGRRKGKWEFADVNDTVPAHVLADPELQELVVAPVAAPELDVEAERLMDLPAEREACAKSFGAAWDRQDASGQMKILSGWLAARFAATSTPAKSAPGEAWISVEDRLPEPGVSVLAYRPMAENTQDPRVTITFYCGPKTTRVSPQGVKHGFDCWCHPTHWSPIPGAPSPHSPEGAKEQEK